MKTLTCFLRLCRLSHLPEEWRRTLTCRDLAPRFNLNS
jgi:hypothetical protein